MRYYNGKLSILGGTGVGKSSLVGTAIKGKYSNYTPANGQTVGFENGWHHVEIKDDETGEDGEIVKHGETVGISIWDMGGEKRYMPLAPMYWKGSHVIAFAFA